MNAQIVLMLYVEGTSADNAPHLRRSDDRPLRTILVRPLPCVPPVAAIGMTLHFGEDELYVIREIAWVVDREMLSLYASYGVIYRDQAPSAEEFFDRYVAEMLELDWKRPEQRV
jgi:hypothetical protein